MRVTSVGHAGFRLDTQAGSILCDPWVNPAYFASWFPFPDNSTLDWDALGDVDYLYVSHLHADHCGGNHLFAGKPIYVQRRELDDARSKDDYTIREWVEAPGVQYVPVDGEHELLPGLRLVPAPGHTPGMQMVVVETGGRPVIVGGDVAVWFGEFDEPPTEGRKRVLALDPELVWLTHEHEPWRPGHEM